MNQFTQKTNDLKELGKVILASKHERVIRLPRTPKVTKKTNLVAKRTAIVRQIQKETGVDEPTARGIMKIRGLK